MEQSQTNIIESNEQNFMADVIEASSVQPVVVDFWAPWCGPCKTLGPALESAINKRGGKIKMVKINVDENQMIAGQLQIQSIPTVYAFVNGQPVDGFQGAQGPAAIEQFLDRLAADAPNSPIDDALDQADALVEAGEIDAAGQYFGAVLAQEPQNARAIVGLASIVIELGDLEKAKEILANLDENDKDKASSLFKRIAVLEAAADAGDTDALIALIDANPDDHQARLDLSAALFARGDSEGAVHALLESFKRDREWNDGAAKAKLIELFDAMDPKDPALARGRRNFAGLVFA